MGKKKAKRRAEKKAEAKLRKKLAFERHRMMMGFLARVFIEAHRTPRQPPAEPVKAAE